ncbi:MAG: RagB/SusD family nutrient uptake outer membrane protein [Gemmatimonadota bacterium]|nr:RagB/SusD family nutrient uptake outer membrane protein [Gemmatimonadota bacterium]
MPNSHTRKGSSVSRAISSRAFALGAALSMTAIVLGTAACKDITTLQQSNPGQLSSSTVFTPANAQLIVNSAQGDFECAYNEYIVASGLFVDELANAISNTANFDLDRRTITPSSPYGTSSCNSQQQAAAYSPLAVARASNDTAVAHLHQWTDAEVPTRSKLIGVASVYAGFSLILLGEGSCTVAINLGPEQTDAQIFAEAKIRFDTAVAAATRAADTPTLNLALLGRARAQLDLGNSAAAAADAALIPSGFSATIGHDAVVVRRQNLVFIHTQLSNYSSVDTSIQNKFNLTRDPRIAFTSTGKIGSDGKTLIVFPNKDAAATTPQVLAKYSEAQLIIAENKANTGDLAGAVVIINTLEAANGQPAFVPVPLTKAAVIAQIIEERRREFFLEGHRLGDIRRYGIPIQPVAGAPYVNGGFYDTQSCFPLPDVERINNPSIPKP